MSSFLRIFGVVTLAFAVSACQPKPEPVKPNSDQQASLNRLHKNCIAASPGKQGKLRNLPRYRKRSMQFACDEMKRTCETDYASDFCKSMMVVASVENAHQRACRVSRKAATSTACRKLRDCNGKGFESQECTTAIARYNK